MFAQTFLDCSMNVPGMFHESYRAHWEYTGVLGTISMQEKVGCWFRPIDIMVMTGPN